MYMVSVLLRTTNMNYEFPLFIKYLDTAIYSTIHKVFGHLLAPSHTRVSEYFMNRRVHCR